MEQAEMRVVPLRGLGNTRAPCPSIHLFPTSFSGRQVNVGSSLFIQNTWCFLILCVYISILVFCSYSFCVFVTKQHPSPRQLQQRWGLEKKGGRRSHFHSPHSAMESGSALLSSSMQGGTMINLLHKGEDALYLVCKKNYKKHLENILRAERLRKSRLLRSLQLSLKVD